MGCGAGKEMAPPPSPDAIDKAPSDNRLEELSGAWSGSKKSASPTFERSLSSPTVTNPDSVSQVQDFAGNLHQLETKAGPLCPKSTGAKPLTRPSSADRARPTTGKKRDSKSRPSSAGRREPLLKPTIWLEPVQAKKIHEAEQGLKDIFSNRPRSAGSRKKKRNKSPQKIRDRTNRPSSAERNREGDCVKSSVWLTDKSKPNVMKIDCDTKDQNDQRPGSAGRTRTGLAPLRESGPLRGMAAGGVDQNGVKRLLTP